MNLSTFDEYDQVTVFFQDGSPLMCMEVMGFEEDHDEGWCHVITTNGQMSIPRESIKCLVWRSSEPRVVH